MRKTASKENISLIVKVHWELIWVPVQFFASSSGVSLKGRPVNGYFWETNIWIPLGVLADHEVHDFYSLNTLISLFNTTQNPVGRPASSSGAFSQAGILPPFIIKAPGFMEFSLLALFNPCGSLIILVDHALSSPVVFLLVTESIAQPWWYHIS